MKMTATKTFQVALPYTTNNAQRLNAIKEKCNARVWVDGDFVNIQVAPLKKNLKKIEKILRKTLDKSN
jgi:hypothetical protein